ncbi:hypothetical protein LYNGBM3L_75660, partial [Moorena producens 3L]
ACLTDSGRLLLVLGGLGDMLRAPWVAATSKQRIIAGPAAERSEDVRELLALTAAGRFDPVIDRRFRVEEIVEAHRYVDTGRKRGNVIVEWDAS